MSTVDDPSEMNPPARKNHRPALLSLLLAEASSLLISAALTDRFDTTGDPLPVVIRQLWSGSLVTLAASVLIACLLTRAIASPKLLTHLFAAGLGAILPAITAKFISILG